MASHYLVTSAYLATHAIIDVQRMRFLIKTRKDNIADYRRQINFSEDNIKELTKSELFHSQSAFKL